MNPPGNHDERLICRATEILVLRFDNLLLRATAPDSNGTGQTILKIHFAIRDLTIQALISAVPQDMKISIWWSNREGRFCSGSR